MLQKLGLYSYSENLLRLSDQLSGLPVRKRRLAYLTTTTHVSMPSRLGHGLYTLQVLPTQNISFVITRYVKTLMSLYKPPLYSLVCALAVHLP